MTMCTGREHEPIFWNPGSQSRRPPSNQVPSGGCKEHVALVMLWFSAWKAQGCTVQTACPAASQWHVRHGGLLGVKYIVAVRSDMADRLLTKVCDAIPLQRSIAAYHAVVCKAVGIGSFAKRLKLAEPKLGFGLWLSTKCT
jgi:hypothetical protein